MRGFEPARAAREGTAGAGVEAEVEVVARVTLTTLSTELVTPAKEWAGALPVARAVASASETPAVLKGHLNLVYQEPDRWCEWWWWRWR